MNRLTQAKHVAVHDGGAKILGQYAEKLTYADARGNIAAIQRYGVIPGASYPSGMIDNLSFTIKPGSNQLQRVADAAPTEFAPRGFKPTAGAQNIDYTYDPVGNQTSDPHKGITITYNYLNLPSVILWSNGNKMEMSYDAMGTKLSKKVSVGATEQYTQHYLGGIEYNAVGTTRKLEAIYFADGRVYNTNVTTANTTVALRYEYAIRDHLGNTRLMFADLDNLGTISSNEILQENHYYPFGMNMEGVWMNDAGSKDSKYQYNGKELNDDFGLGWIDYGARWYDPAIAHWNAVDPLADKMRSWSPYNYVFNNPISYVDPDGRSGELVIDKEKKTITINAHITFYGSGGSKEQAAQSATDINKLWNDAGGKATIDGTEYSVVVNVTAEYNENLSEDDVTKNEDVTKNFIKVVEDGIDVSEMALGGNTGVWLKKNIDGANTTTEAHEFGHGLGLEHPESTNLIGKGQPGIMHPRGTLVDAEFTYDPKQGASKVNSDGVPMNSVNPNKRKVLQSDIDNLNLGSQFYDTNGRGNLGGLTNTFHK